MRKDIRIFALDRIRKCEQVSETFEIPESFDFEDFIKNRFGIFHGEPTAVKIRFSADIAGYIKEKIWHASQEIEEQEDGSIIFSLNVAGTDEIKFWIMSWGSQARVLAPDALGREIRSEAKALLQTYSKCP
jgi:proteasome accessory factor B